jgi:hypothetical protein
MARVPTAYATNTVACKLWSLVNEESPIEFILGLALFDELSNLYPEWRCWIYSRSDFSANSQVLQQRQDVFIIVPGLNVPDVGHVDFAIFAPQISLQNPLVVVECDGHKFHECTPDQASEDRRRDRVLQRLGFPLLRFTGSDIVRNTTEVAREIGEFVDQKLNEKHARLAEVAEREAEYTELMYRRFGAL